MVRSGKIERKTSLAMSVEAGHRNLTGHIARECPIVNFLSVCVVLRVGEEGLGVFRLQCHREDGLPVEIVFIEGCARKWGFKCPEECIYDMVAFWTRFWIVILAILTNSGEEFWGVERNQRTLAGQNSLLDLKGRLRGSW
jgi:hypothetical protein